MVANRRRSVSIATLPVCENAGAVSTTTRVIAIKDRRNMRESYHQEYRRSYPGMVIGPRACENFLYNPTHGIWDIHTDSAGLNGHSRTTGIHQKSGIQTSRTIL